MGELPPEPLPRDGSILHAVERLASHACESSGHHWKLLCESTPTPTTRPATKLSVLEAKTDVFMQATYQLARRFRRQEKQLVCANVSLERCTK